MKRMKKFDNNLIINMIKNRKCVIKMSRTRDNSSSCVPKMNKMMN